MLDPSVEIAGHGARLAINVRGYERPDASETSDANWLVCDIALTVARLNASTRAAVVTNDFVHFRRGLEEMLDAAEGAARFDTYEETLLIEVTLRKSGQAVVSGRLRVSDAPLATVSFEFESDQTYLMSTRDQLKRVATEFPVVTQVRDPAAERETE